MSVCGCVEGIVEPAGAVVEPAWAVWVRCGVVGTVRGPSCCAVGPSEGSFPRCPWWRRSGSHVGPSWSRLGPSGCAVGAPESSGDCRGALSGRRKGRLRAVRGRLGPCLSRLGALLECKEALWGLGPGRAPLGALPQCSEAAVGLSWVVWGRRRIRRMVMRAISWGRGQARERGSCGAACSEQEGRGRGPSGAVVGPWPGT